MIQLTIAFATIDEAHEALGKLNGVSTAAVSIDDTAAAPKKQTPKAKADAATKDGFADEPKKPAGKKAAAKKAPSIDELKAHILEHAGDGADQPAKVKEYVRSFGVTKISDLTEAQRQEAFDGAEEYFAAQGGDEEGEEDPMA